MKGSLYDLALAPATSAEAMPLHAHFQDGELDIYDKIYRPTSTEQS